MRKLILTILILIPSVVFALTFDSGSGGAAGGGGSANVDGTAIAPNTVTASTITSNQVITSCFTVVGSSATFGRGAFFNQSKLNTSAGSVTVYGNVATPNLFSDAINNWIGIQSGSPRAALDIGDCPPISFIDANSDICVADDVEIKDDLYVLGQSQIAIASDDAPRTNVQPTTTFQLIVNTGATPDQICIATGTASTTQWALLSNFSTACSN